MTQAKLTDAERERVRERESVRERERRRKHYIDSRIPGLINETSDAPRWKDEEAHLEYVRKRILAGWTLVFPFRSEEERAVEAALRGDLRKLKAFIKTNPQLTQRTRDLVVEFLGGKRSLRTGRAKG